MIFITNIVLYITLGTSIHFLAIVSRGHKLSDSLFLSFDDVALPKCVFCLNFIALKRPKRYEVLTSLNAIGFKLKKRIYS